MNLAVPSAQTAVGLLLLVVQVQGVRHVSALSRKDVVCLHWKHIDTSHWRYLIEGSGISGPASALRSLTVGGESSSQT